MKLLSNLDSLDNILDGESRKLPVNLSDLNNDLDFVLSEEVGTLPLPEDINIRTKDIYSTDEIVVGKWIDGKPLYRKVGNITFTSIYTGAGAHTVGTNISKNIDFGTIEGVFSNQTIRNNLYNGYNVATGSNIYISNSGNDKGNIMGFTNRSDFINVPFYVSVLYTKTTD